MRDKRGRFCHGCPPGPGQAQPDSPSKPKWPPELLAKLFGRQDSGSQS
jgi:hypothetical protein